MLKALHTLILSFQPNRQRKGQVETFVINPKCVTLGELYGEMNTTTFEWTDGLIARAARSFSRAKSREIAEAPANSAQDFDKMSSSEIADDVVSTVVDLTSSGS